MGRPKLSNLLFWRKLSKIEPRWGRFLLIYFILSIISVRVKDTATIPIHNIWPDWHRDCITGNMLAPLQYRCLAFLIAEFFIRFLNVGVIQAYMFERLIFIFITVFLFHLYLRRWFSTEISFAGCLFIFAIIPLTCFPHIQPADPINFLVFLIGFWLIRENRIFYLYPLILLGTLNKETTIFLIMAYFFVNIERVRVKTVFLNTLGLSFIWLCTYIGLRMYYGWKPYFCEFFQFYNNLNAWKQFPDLLNLHHAGQLFWFFLFGILWILAFVGYKSKPRFLRRSSMIIPFFMIGHFIIASMLEVRLFLPLSFNIIPMAFYSLFNKNTNE